jgi:hypothetical protein
MKELFERFQPNDDDLLGRLYSAEVIEDHQKDDLKYTLSTNEKIRKLMNLLSKRSVADFEKFVECVRTSGLDHVVYLFEISKGEYRGLIETYK